MWRALLGGVLMLVGGGVGIYMLLNLPDEGVAYSAGYAAGSIVVALLLVRWGWRLRSSGRKG